MYKLIFKVILVAAVGAGIWFYFFDDSLQVPQVDVPEVSYQEATKETGRVEEGEERDGLEEGEERKESEGEEEVPENTEPIEEGADLPSQFNLAVPFTPQAPHADWALPYQEACEEASAYMVAEYLNGTPSGLIDADVADAALLEVVAFQEDYFGYYLDTTAAETVEFIDFFYGYGATVVEDPTVEMIKAEIAAGRPVIVPAAGQELGNPFFSGDGPLYHMFVIKGYTEDKFIVNDPGTRNGESYVYDINVIMDAMGDWNNGDPAQGAKRVIFVNP